MMPRPTRTLHRTLAIAALLIFSGYLIYSGHFYWQSQQQVEQGESPRFTDYTSTYAGSLLALREPAANLYVTERMIAAQVDAAHAAYPDKLSREQAESHGFARWLYPPIFILFCMPLALLPYIPSLIAWLGLTAIPYLICMKTILPQRYGLLLALAAPPTFYNIQYGQTGFLTAGLIGLGLALLRSHPTLAGVLIGCAAFKPNFGVLIPFALAAGGYWWAFTCASVVVISLIATSIIAFGVDPWLAFIGTSGYAFEGFARNMYDFETMVTPLGAVRSLGIAVEPSWILQGVASALCLAAVIWAWCQNRQALGLQSAVLCCASLLATPMAYLYDLTLLVPAAAWLLADMFKRGYRPLELYLLIVAMILILPLFKLVPWSGIPLGPLMPLTLLLLALNRLRSHTTV